MHRRAVLAGIVGVGAGVVAGCSSGNLPRMIMMGGPDVEDYRQFPSRTVAAAKQPLSLPEAPDPDWQARAALAYAGTDLSSGPALDRLLADNSTTAFLVLHKGVLVDERYFNGYAANTLCKSFSISKSVLSALIGIARGDGLVKLEDTVAQHLPDMAAHPAGKVTLEQLLGCTAGFAYQRGFAPWADQPKMYYTRDVRKLVRQLELASTPGSAFVEEDYSPLLAGVVLEAALRKHAPGDSLSAFAERRLWGPMGAGADALWVTDRPDDGFEKTESGFVARARDLALFGQMFLDGGRVGGRQIVPADWVRQCAAPPPQGAPNRFTDGYLRHLWWGRLQPDGSYHSFANGHFGQRVYLAPKKQLVLVRFGADRGEIDWSAFLNAIATRWTAG